MSLITAAVVDLFEAILQKKNKYLFAWEKAEVFSPHHLQSRWVATNAKDPYIKGCR